MKTDFEQTGITGCLTLADWIINSYADFNLPLAEYNNQFLDMMQPLKRARKEFDARMFFVVIYGPVKSGKSTLTNAFARQYVSPSKFGVECTVRPSIIMRSEDTGIYEYFPNEQGVDDKKYFDLIIDYLRGMETEETLKKHVHVEKHAFTRAMVEKKLASDTDKKPLITVIKVPGGEFVGPGICIIDMPGLDGRNCNIQETPVYNWFLQRTDFLIFVQSSMAAINIETAKFLETLVAQSKNPPTWLIQNIIEAKHWRSREEQEQETNNQLIETKKELIKLLNPPEKDIQATAINLGKAFDGIDKGDGTLLEESGFIEFEQQLKRLLDAKRVRIGEKNSLTGMLKTAVEMDRKIADLCLAITRRNKEAATLRQLFGQVALVIDEITYSHMEIQKHTANLKVHVENTKTRLIENLRTETDMFKQQTNRQMSGQQFNSKLKQFYSHVLKMCNSTYFNLNSHFGNSLVKEINESIAAMEASYLKSISAKLAEINTLIEDKALGVKEVAAGVDSLPQFNATGLQEVIPNSFDLDVWLLKEKRLIFMEATYDGGFTGEKTEDLYTDLVQFINTCSVTWTDNTAMHVFNTYCEERRENYRSVVRELRQSFDSDIEAVMGKNNEVLAFADRFASDLRKLADLLRPVLNDFSL